MRREGVEWGLGRTMRLRRRWRRRRHGCGRRPVVAVTGAVVAVVVVVMAVVASGAVAKLVVGEQGARTGLRPLAAPLGEQEGVDVLGAAVGAGLVALRLLVEALLARRRAQHQGGQKEDPQHCRHLTGPPDRLLSDTCNAC